MTVRSPLKWPGGKARLAGDIANLLPHGKRLVEPFMGSGAVFLNTDYDEYILSDINPNLIQLYKNIQQAGEAFIAEAKQLFVPENNNADQYYAFREEYNSTQDSWRKSVLLLWLNRHGFNGLYRENKSGDLNVPFGRYDSPYFPEAELRLFLEKSRRATFLCADFREVMDRVPPESVVYVDPPYLPASKTADFSTYAKDGFTTKDHHDLADKCKELSDRGIPVLASNHDVPLVHKIYEGAEIVSLEVSRFISRDTANRRKAKEVLALFKPDHHEVTHMSL